MSDVSLVTTERQPYFSCHNLKSAAAATLTHTYRNENQAVITINTVCDVSEGVSALSSCWCGRGLSLTHLSTPRPALLSLVSLYFSSVFVETPALSAYPCCCIMIFNMSDVSGTGIS